MKYVKGLPWRSLRSLQRFFQFHRRQKFWLLAALGVVVSFWVTACSPSQTETAQPTANAPAARVVRIGHQKLDPFTLVKARGGLEKRLEPMGVTVEWTEFQSPTPMMEAMNVGSVDAGRTGDTAPIVAQAAGVPFVYFASSPTKDHSSAILVRGDSPIKTIADLRGQKIAYVKGASSHHLLFRVLQSAGLGPDDVELVDLSHADARTALEQGQVAAWSTVDPFYAASEKQFNARPLRDNNGLTPNRDFFLATRSYAEKNADVLKAIQAEVASTNTWAAAHQKEVAQILSPLLGIDQPIVEYSIARRDFGIISFTDQITQEQQKLADLFFQLKVIPQPIRVANAVWQAPPS